MFGISRCDRHTDLRARTGRAPPQCAVKSYRSAGVAVIVGVLLLSSATGWSPRRFSFRRSSLLAWRSSFFISRRSLRERSAAATDEFGVWDVDELGEADADGSKVGRGVSVGRGVAVAVSTGVAVARAVANGIAVAVAVVSGLARPTAVAVAAMV